MEKKRNPKLEFEKGKKYKLTLKDGFTGEALDKKKNDGSMRPWYGFNVIYNDIEHTTFIDRAAFEELSRYGHGTIVEMIDNDTSEAFYLHDWQIHSVGNTDTLDIQMSESKNQTEIKIQTYASMKIASAISSNIDELKTNTWAVIELHKEVCKSIENEEEMFDSVI